MLLILRHQAKVDCFLKQNIIFANKIFKKKKTEDVNKKILNTSGMVKKINYNTKITEKWNT